ncbi:MAG: NnrS family protein [Rhodocyclales bacterium]|nr:NnrS family protein [Rhodocyclales bacterium]MBI5784806.1 NnrS family protein [Rhodocyclales bacterium]
MALIPLGEPVRRAPPGGFALWALGFRPFYLLAAAFAAIAILAWLFVLTGRLAMPMAGIWWHAHEMLFGFAAAVIVGFLFTAGRNWTGLDTPTGRPLAALALLWLAGRLGMAFGGGIVTVLVDSAFLPVAAAAIARVLWRAGSRRNYFVVAILGLLSLANIAFHLARIGMLAIDPLQALHFALGMIILLETVIGGRVIPSFTASALHGVRQWQSQPWNYAAIAATGVALLGWVVLPDARWPAALSLLAVALQLPRCIGWNPWATRRTPLLWILHVSHLWIPFGLALLAAAQLGWLPRSAGVHALTIGATGGLIVGMITRTALGHTGRMIIVGRIETSAYALVQIAAVVRVLTVAAVPAAAVAGIHVAATLWALAFLLYLWRYLPWLIRPRVDGQPG